MIKRLRNKRNVKILITALLLAVVVLSVPNLAWAVGAGGTGSGDSTMSGSGRVDNNKKIEKSGSIQVALANALSWIIYGFTYAAVWILSIVLRVMLTVMQYNGFLDERMVQEGWKIVRDVCNNFFIIILMVIAVGTILRVQKYHYKQLMPKLLTMAILINFSKMFTGIMIDFSQVIMLTFASALYGVNAQNLFLGALNIPNTLSLEVFNDPTKKFSIDTGKTAIQIWQIVTALLFAGIIAIVALVVVTIITIVFVYRIIMLWFLVILSPFAFLASTFPRAQSYAERWWSNLFKFLVVGPAMVFFLYLSFYLIGQMNSGDGWSEARLTKYNKKTFENETALKDKDNVWVEKLGLGFSKAGTAFGVYDYLILIGLMVGSLVVAQEMGGSAGALAGKTVSMMSGAVKKPVFKGLAKVRNAAWGGAKGTVRLGLGTAKGALTTTSRAIDRGIDKVLPEKVKGTAKIIKDVGAKAVTGAVVGSVVGAPGAIVGGFLPILAKVKQVISGKMSDDKKTRMDNLEGKYEYENKQGEKSVYKFKTIGDKTYKVDENTGEFIDKGKDADYKYKEENGKYYRIDDNGKYLNKGGEEAFNQAEAEVDEATLLSNVDSRTEGEIGSGEMGEGMKDFWTGFYSSSAGKAQAVRESAKAEEVDKLKSDYMRYSASILNRMYDLESNKTKKMALAMTLAIKDGFKGKDNSRVSEVKKSLGGNSVMVKQFNDEVDKKFAHKNYDLSKATGQAKFNKRREDGKFDVLDASAYQDDKVIRTLQEGLTIKEFPEYMNKVGKVSSKHQASLQEGLSRMIRPTTDRPQEEIVMLDQEKLFMPAIKSLMAIDGNIARPFSGFDLDKNVKIINPKTGQEESERAGSVIARGLKNLFKKLNNKQIASISSDSFDINKIKTQFGGNEEQAREFRRSLAEAISSKLEEKDLRALERSPDMPKELYDQLSSIVKNKNDSGLEDDGSIEESTPQEISTNNNRNQSSDSSDNVSSDDLIEKTRRGY